jgi:hypothetical protein
MAALSDRHDPPDSDLVLHDVQLYDSPEDIAFAFRHIGLKSTDLEPYGEHEKNPQVVESALQELSNSPSAVSLGKPTAVPLSKAMGEPPSALLQYLMLNQDFYFVGLFCSFHSMQGAVRTQKADFKATFRCDAEVDQPVVHDLDPREVNTEIKVARKVILDPSARFSEIQLGVGGLEFSIEYTRLKPVIAGGGDGEATAFWEYRATKAQELSGGKRMYVVIRVPKGTQAVDVQCDISANVEAAGRLFRRKLMPSDRLDIRLW